METGLVQNGESRAYDERRLRGRRRSSYAATEKGTDPMAKMDFGHKVVLLTGASGGIGAGIAHSLSKQRAQLLVSGRSMSDLKRLIRELPSPEKAVPIDADPAQPGEA